ncbi:MAG: signal peptidase I [Candidatus Margulisbacteria bacterium]|nr:signal peptidase I [Candidatus Margulisiibacteriota bacterium]
MPRLKHWAFDWLETIVVALALALIIRAFFLQVFWIPSGSMEPTLDINDRIVVNKVAFNFMVPKRLEVVVFRGVGGVGEAKKDLIKRVIGLPGEKLEVIKGGIFINGVQVTEKHPMNEDFANFGPVTVPSDAYFVMGDNRPASADSRYWGFLPKKNLIGPAFLRIWPLTKFGFIP